jgi:hypothetical protein
MFETKANFIKSCEFISAYIAADAEDFRLEEININEQTIVVSYKVKKSQDQIPSLLAGIPQFIFDRFYKSIKFNDTNDIETVKIYNKS